MKNGSLKEDHKMWRYDTSLEDIALRKESKKRQEFMSHNTSKEGHSTRNQENMYQDPIDQIYSKTKPSK
jgi:hypothetical protein